MRGIRHRAELGKSPYRNAESFLEFYRPSGAYARGFFREEGIDAEIIRIATNVGIVAVTTKEIGYTTAVGAGLRGAVKGLPLKVIMYFNGRPLHVLRSKTGIQNSGGAPKKKLSVSPGTVTRPSSC